MLLAGDALSLINPFTGEGIFYAVLLRRAGRRGGGRLARARPPGGTPPRCAAGSAATCGTAGRRRGWPGGRRVVDAAVRAARRDGRVFGPVVELGLGDGVFDLRTIGRIDGIGLGDQAIGLRGLIGRAAR